MDPPACDIESSSAELRVEGVAHNIAEHDEREYCQGQEDAREDQHVRGGPDQTDPEASEIWMPQEMAGGCSPMPRKDRSPRRR